RAGQAADGSNTARDLPGGRTRRRRPAGSRRRGGRAGRRLRAAGPPPAPAGRPAAGRGRGGGALNRRAPPARVPPRREVGAVVWWAWLLIGWLVLSVVGALFIGALAATA